jgi:XTP/dITP diphosphohydrolase
MNLLIATSNKGKVIEISDCLKGLAVSIHTIDAFNLPHPKETGKSCAENAELKARYYFNHSGFPTVADDSGIAVEALGDELGLHTRRWGAGEHASDEEWITYFLDRLKHESNRRAHFVTHLAYLDKNGMLHEFEGKCSGHITDQLQSDYHPGIPISACFIPDGETAVYSALSVEQKNSTSHRGKATKKLREFLEKRLEVVKGVVEKKV